MSNRHLKYLAVLAGFYFGTFHAAMSQRVNIGDILKEPSNNYFVITQKADAFFAQYGKEGTGWKEYNRWKAMVKSNISADGTLPDFVKNNQQALDNYKSKNAQIDAVQAGVSNWVPLGQPNPTIQAGDAQNGVGRTSSVDFVGSDIWVSTPGGGMWFGDFVGGSTYNWTAKTDGIPNLAVQDIEIAPTNTNIMYALTGAVGGASGYRSTGVLKSTDAGTTWFKTGLSFPESGGVKGYKLLVHPGNSSIVWACTDNGLFRTADGGTTWTLVTYYLTAGGAQTNISTNAYDIVYQPGSTTNMYATSNGPYFYKSTDGGLTFLRIDRATAGLPTTGGRIQIGVTAANSAYIYLLYGNGTSFQALYRSTNSGTSFSLRSTTPNVLGSQSWRNICIDVSPTNTEDLYVGGLDIYKSTNGGTGWTQISNWFSSSVSDFSHADIFELKCDGTYLYAAGDGGIYRMTRSTDTWTSLMTNMQTSQCYRLAVDPTASAAFVTTGLQDNGTYRNTGAQYLSIGGGDGMESVINPSNTNVIYLSSQNGNFSRSDDGGTSNTFIRSGPGNWTTPAVLRPGFSTHIYIGYVNIDYHTASGSGGSWSTITTSFGSAIESLEFAPSDNTILYATDGASVKRFNLSGGVWSTTTITGSLPSLNITELAVDPNNSSHVVLSVGGYTSTQKVYETFNANVASPTWTSIVRNLPNVPINCIVMNSDAANSIYVGTDIGVFVTNDNRVNWIMYSNGLPVTRVYDLEINNAIATDRIYAATFGRGVFYTETYTGCATSAALTGSVSGLEYSEVSTELSSTQYIWGGEGTSVGYNSGGSILLSPGFEAKAGTKFEAYLQGCTGSGTPPRPLKLLPSTNKITVEQSGNNINPQGGDEPATGAGGLKTDGTSTDKKLPLPLPGVKKLKTNPSQGGG
ncbi:MAG: 3-coathanger stack domain-containing protein [Bacteroidota bacterium]